MSDRFLTLEPLLQSWQHFLLIFSVSYFASSIWAPFLANSLSHPVFLALNGASQLRAIAVADALSVWASLVLAVVLCLFLYFRGHEFRAHLALFLATLTPFIGHLALLGRLARGLVPVERKRILAALLAAIARDGSPAVARWRDGVNCAGPVGCADAAVTFLKTRTVLAFWVSAGILGLTVTATAAMAIVVLVMGCIRPEEDDRPDSDRDLERPLSDCVAP
jgi:hypothetical protein